VFPPISAVLGLLFFASALPNGIRIDSLPAGSDAVEIVAGYASGGLADFSSTGAAKALLVDAYAVGGDIQFLNEIDRTAVRIVAPSWSAPVLFEHLPGLFKDVPSEDAGNSPVTAADFRARVEEEIRDALLGANVSEPEYATGDAFVLSSVPAPKSLLDALAAIPRRGSANRPQEPAPRLAAERTLRFKSDLASGAVIFAAPAPAVFYKEWYLLLLLDKLIHRVVTLPVQTLLPLNVRPYYYRIELPLSAGQFPEPAEANLLQELERLQFTRASLGDLNAARQDAFEYLDSKDVQEWFASHGIADRRDEGVQWLQGMTPDDLRAAARDLLLMNRVVATWAPTPKSTTVSVEPLASASPAPPAKPEPDRAKDQEQSREPDSAKPKPDLEIAIAAFPVHTDASTATPVAERLSSGVSLVRSNTNAVFVAGGSMTRFDHEPAAADLKTFSGFRAERILVLAPPASLENARQLWSNFKGSTSGPTGVPKGKVSSGDLPALFILKTMLDLKLIDAGWWKEAKLRIDATEGSTLQITADSGKRAQILDWIKMAGTTPPAEKYFSWAREVAVHRFRLAMPDMQALIWERDPQGTVPDLSSVNRDLIQDVARIYF
jgi:hypothetical protein